MSDSTVKIEKMEVESIPKLLLKYSSVTFCALLFSSLYNIADTLFVSYGIGDTAMAGVSVVYPFMMLQGAFAQTVGSGAGTLVSKFLGERNYKKAGEVTVSAMFAFYITTAAVGALCVAFCPTVLKLLGADGEIYPYAKDYFIIIAAGNVFSTGFSSIIRAEGRMGYSLLIWLIPTAFNILADYVLIFVFDMGVKGAAIATVVSQIISFLMSVVFFKHISCQQFKNAKPRFREIKNIFSLGVPALLQMGGMSAVFLVINKCLSYYFTAAWVSAFAYVGKIAAFLIIPFNAIIQASSPIISYNYGAGNRKRISKTLKCCVLVLMAYSVAAVMMIEFMSPRFMSVFTKDRQIVTIGANALRIIAVSAFFLPHILIFGTYFQAVGSKKKSLLINLLLVIVLSLFIAVFAVIDCNKIWFSIPIGCFTSFLISVAVYKRQ